jgi:hypothetical protein
VVRFRDPALVPRLLVRDKSQAVPGLGLRVLASLVGDDPEVVEAAAAGGVIVQAPGRIEPTHEAAFRPVQSTRFQSNRPAQVQCPRFDRSVSSLSRKVESQPYPTLGLFVAAEARVGAPAEQCKGRRVTEVSLGVGHQVIQNFLVASSFRQALGLR